LQQAPPPTALETSQPMAASSAAAPSSVATPPASDSAALPVPASQAPAAANSAVLELNVAAGKATEIRVVADGKAVLEGKIAAGQGQRFRAEGKFEVGARDSSAVVLELNGQTVAPLGPAGSPGSVTLTRQDLKKPAGGND